MLDSSTLLAVFLIVLAASLSSYAASVWVRRRGRSGGWAGTGFGAFFIVAGAVIVVVSMAVVSPLSFPRPEWLLRLMIEPTPSGDTAGESAEPLEASMLPAAVTGPARREDVQSDASLRNEGRRTSHEEPVYPERAGSSSQPSPGESARPTPGATPAARDALLSPDPWAATRCVLAIHLDPSDPLRWTIENECGLPVGVLIAACDQSPAQCYQRSSTSWRYRPGGMILPAKIQRPVTEAEQTQVGRTIRYVACFVTTPEARQLIAGLTQVPAETGLSPAEQFDAARAQDGCLAWVQRWSYEGNRTGLSIDVLLGGSQPPNAFRQD